MLTARALAIVHTCTYDAWAAHEARALGTMFGDALRRPPQEHTLAAKEVAVSYAAFRALVNLFPSQSTVFERVMEEMGLDPTYESTDPSTPAGVGNAACGAVLTWRAHDGANQFGDLSGGSPYSDYTGYVPVNSPTQLADPGRWQPLITPAGTPQVFLAPHWRHVTPFALTAADQFRPDPPPEYPNALPPAGRSRPAPQRRPRRSEQSRRRILGGRPRDRNSPGPLEPPGAVRLTP